MGTHRNGDLPPDGDRWPDEPLDLPDLPDLPDGVVVPDDLSALAAEAEQVRAELARESHDSPWFTRDSAATRREPAVGAPLVIMTVAVVITLVSMFAMLMSGSGGRAPALGGTPVPGIVLTDNNGEARNLAALTPVAIILVEECDCGRLIADTVRAAPPGVTVVAVGLTPPPPPAELTPGTGRLVLLGDPDGVLRSALNLRGPPANAATVVIADQTTVTRTTPATNTIESYRDALTALADR